MDKAGADSEPALRRPILFKGREDLSKVFRIASETGFRAAFKAVGSTLWGRYFRLSDRAFDRRYGVDTYAVAYPGDLTIEGDNISAAHHYEPTFVGPFNRMLAELPADLSDFVFLDYGSGKGKALLLASHRNFKRVIGVEFAEELHSIAVRNIGLYKSRKQRCVRIDSVCADAVGFPLPEDCLVLYFDNPFGPPVLTDVVGNLEASYRASPRKIFIIYENPKYREVFDRLDFLRVRPRRRFNWKPRVPSPYKFVIYESA